MSEEEESEYQRGSGRCVIQTTCTTHGGTPGFVNLIARKINGGIELDPHGLNTCIIRLDEDGAGMLREWLG